MSAVESSWLLCKCGSPDMDSMMICTEFGRGVLMTCTKCGFRVEYRRAGADIREFVHVRKGEVPMETKIHSTVIRTASFDDARGVIQLTFTNGVQYEYAPDPEAEDPPDMKVLYLSLVHAESAGLFFAKFIRPKTSKLIATKLPPPPQKEDA